VRRSRLSEYVVDKPLEAGIEVGFELVVVRRDDPILFRRRRVDGLYTGRRIWARERQRPAVRAFITDIPLPPTRGIRSRCSRCRGRPCVEMAFQKVVNEANFSFAIIFSGVAQPKSWRSCQGTAVTCRGLRMFRTLSHVAGDET
jgi:hypothetical protein